MSKEHHSGRQRLGMVHQHPSLGQHAKEVQDMVEWSRFDASGVQLATTMGSMLIAVYRIIEEQDKTIRHLKILAGYQTTLCPYCETYAVELIPNTDRKLYGKCVCGKEIEREADV